MLWVASGADQSDHTEENAPDVNMACPIGAGVVAAVAVDLGVLAAAGVVLGVLAAVGVVLEVLVAVGAAVEVALGGVLVGVLVDPVTAQAAALAGHPVQPVASAHVGEPRIPVPHETRW